MDITCFLLSHSDTSYRASLIKYYVHHTPTKCLVVNWILVWINPFLIIGEFKDGVNIKLYTWRNWLTQLWRMLNLKSVEWISRLKPGKRAWCRWKSKFDVRILSCWWGRGGGSVFCFIWSSTDFMRPIHVMKSNLLHSKFNNLNNFF